MAKLTNLFNMYYLLVHLVNHIFPSVVLSLITVSQEQQFMFGMIKYYVNIKLPISLFLYHHWYWGYYSYY